MRLKYFYLNLFSVVLIFPLVLASSFLLKISGRLTFYEMCRKLIGLREPNGHTKHIYQKWATTSEDKLSIKYI